MLKKILPEIFCQFWATNPTKYYQWTIYSKITNLIVKDMYSRTQPDTVKQKISQSMKAVHAHRSPEEKAQIAQKQSLTMKAIWAEIPKATVDDILEEDDE